MVNRSEGICQSVGQRESQREWRIWFWEDGGVGHWQLCASMAVARRLHGGMQETHVRRSGRESEICSDCPIHRQACVMIYSSTLPNHGTDEMRKILYGAETEGIMGNIVVEMCCTYNHIVSTMRSIAETNFVPVPAHHLSSCLDEDPGAYVVWPKNPGMNNLAHSTQPSTLCKTCRSRLSGWHPS